MHAAFSRLSMGLAPEGEAVHFVMPTGGGTALPSGRVFRFVREVLHRLPPGLSQMRRTGADSFTSGRNSALFRLPEVPGPTAFWDRAR